MIVVRRRTISLLAESNTVEEVRTAEVGNWTNIVYWAAVDSSAVPPIELLGYQVVYVAPPVGFRTDALAYSTPVSGAVDTKLAAATVVAATTTSPVEISIRREAGEDITTPLETVASLGSLGPDSIEAYTIAEPLPDALEIVALNGVTFNADEFDLGGKDLGELILRGGLLSIGNARVELRPSDLPPSLSFFELDTFGKAGEISSAFLVTLPPSADKDVSLKVTVTAYEFMPSTLSPTFDLATTNLDVERGSDVSFAVRWGDFGDVVNALPANSFIEIEAEAGSVEGRFRMLVTETGTGPTGKTPVPGAYARAESDNDLRLQSDLGIIEPLGDDTVGYNTVSEIATGVFDYLVANLQPGEVESVVLELAAAVVSEDEGDFLQHKYTEADGWGLFFTETAFDKVYSAPAPCPSREASRDAAWRLATPDSGGVREGDGCILLQIQEGGVNDADMTPDGVLHDPTALSRVIREVPLELVFVDPEGDGTTVKIGGETEVEVRLSGDAALEQLGNSSEVVVVMFSIDPSTAGVAVSPGAITFDNSGSTQMVAIAADLSAMTQLSGVMLKASISTDQHTQLDGLEVPVNFMESTLPVKVLPDFAFADVRNDKPDEFAALITDSAPGARLLLDSGYDAVVFETGDPQTRLTDDDILIVPGTGGRMKLDLYAPVMTKTGDIHVCVWVHEDHYVADFYHCSEAEDYSLLAESNTAEGVRTAEAGNWTNIVYWAAVDRDSVELLGYQVVYVAPPVGFRTSVLAYSTPVSGVVEVDTGLAAATSLFGVEITIVREVGEGEDKSTKTEVVEVNYVAPDSTGAYTITEPLPDALEIVALNGVTFNADKFDLGNEDLGMLILYGELLSIGNARVELLRSELPPRLSFSGLDTFRMEGEVSGTGSFDIMLPDSVQIQDIEVVSSATVTIYEFVPATLESGPTFKVTSTPMIAVRRHGNNLSASWGEAVAEILDNLPANSFIEIEAKADSLEDSFEGRFRMLVTGAGYIGPVDKTPVPGAYAQAEGDGDLRLQSDFGIISRLNGNRVSEIPTGVFDYLIGNLQPGEVVSVVLELAAEVPENEGYYWQFKYTEADDWSPFMETSFDKVYSARAPCPLRVAPRDTAWRLATPDSGGGVREGDKCILLQIQEGGMNDADMTPNGVLHDPTALSLVRPDARRGGGGAMGPAWLILLAGGMLLSAGLRRRRRPAPGA